MVAHQRLPAALLKSEQGLLLAAEAAAEPQADMEKQKYLTLKFSSQKRHSATTVARGKVTQAAFDDEQAPNSQESQNGKTVSLVLF